MTSLSSATNGNSASSGQPLPSCSTAPQSQAVGDGDEGWKQQCQVCGAPADGLHYGAISCRSCNAFFRRSVTFKQKFVCRYDSNCDVNQHVRCACRACRYAKCLRAGMKTTSVQPRRDPTGSQKNRRRLEQDGEPLDNDADYDYRPRFSVSSHHHRVGIGTSPNKHQPNKSALVLSPTSYYPHVSPSVTSPASISATPWDCSPTTAEPPASVLPPKPDTARAIVNLETAPAAPVAKRTSTGARQQSSYDEREMAQLEEFEEFERLVQCYGEHSRHMQLALTNVDDFLQSHDCGIKLRKMLPTDVEKLSNVELSGLLYWIEKQKPYKDLNLEDRTTLLKRYSVRKLSLDHFYNASKYKDQLAIGNFVMLNHTFVPPGETGFDGPKDDEKQREAKNQIFLPTFERIWRCVIAPFTLLRVTDAEMVYLHAMLLWSPLNNTHVSASTKRKMGERREWVVQRLFEHYESIGLADPAVRVGEITLLLPEIEVICDQHCQDFQVAKLFEFCDMSQYWYESLCYSSVNTTSILATNQSHEDLPPSVSPSSSMSQQQQQHSASRAQMRTGTDGTAATTTCQQRNHHQQPAPYSHSSTLPSSSSRAPVMLQGANYTSVADFPPSFGHIEALFQQRIQPSPMPTAGGGPSPTTPFPSTQQEQQPAPSSQTCTTNVSLFAAGRPHHSYPDKLPPSMPPPRLPHLHSPQTMIVVDTNYPHHHQQQQQQQQQQNRAPMATSSSSSSSSSSSVASFHHPNASTTPLHHSQLPSSSWRPSTSFSVSSSSRQQRSYPHPYLHQHYRPHRHD